ncbi:unnamed protein product [Choristocarpus tenellus]
MENGELVKAVNPSIQQSPSMKLMDKVSILHGAVASGDLSILEKHLLQHQSVVVNIGGLNASLGVQSSASPSGLDAMLSTAGLNSSVSAGGLDVKDGNGWTLLHTACWYGQLVAAGMLLSAGADVNANDHDGFTALHRCAEVGQAEAARLLLQRGVPPNKVVQKGTYSALHLACIHGHADVIPVLASYGADTSARDMWQCTPLIRACLEGHLEAARAILRAGGEVDSRDNWKCTGLHRACHRGHVGLVSLLLEKGACLTALDDKGERPGQIFPIGMPEETQQVVKGSGFCVWNKP